jgi:acetyl esterase/lipase
MHRVITALTYRKIRIHGGSFVSGSATGAGLDGSKLAIATNSIVAVVQYRLGAVSLANLMTSAKLIPPASLVLLVLTAPQILGSEM